LVVIAGAAGAMKVSANQISGTSGTSSLYGPVSHMDRLPP